MSKAKNIVIIGGGAGGASVARALSAKLDASKYNIVLINPRAYFVPLPVMPRLVVSNVDNLEEKAFPSLDNVFHNGNLDWPNCIARRRSASKGIYQE